MTYDERSEQAHRYIKSIRNDRKRAYAEEYYEYLVHNEADETPCADGLKAMAAQAVRMSLRSIFAQYGAAR